MFFVLLIGPGVLCQNNYLEVMREILYFEKLPKCFKFHSFSKLFPILTFAIKMFSNTLKQHKLQIL